MSNRKSEVGERLREAREAIGLQQAEFADKFGYSRGYLSQVENGHRKVSDRFYELAKLHFGINPYWLKEGQEPMLIKREAQPYRVAENRSESGPPHRVQTFESIKDVRAWQKSRGGAPADTAIESLLEMTLEVLESGGDYADALAQNVKAFHKAVNADTPKVFRLVELNCTSCNTLSEQPLARIMDGQPVYCPACGIKVHADPEKIQSLLDAVKDYRETLKVLLDPGRDAAAESD